MNILDSSRGLTIHSGTSAYSPSGWDDQRATEQSWACITFVEGESFFSEGQITEVSAWLDVISRFANVRPCLDNLYSICIWFVLGTT
jgi:hypothetical protein